MEWRRWRTCVTERLIGLVAMSDPGHYIKFIEKKYLYLFNLDMYQSIKSCAIELQQIHHQMTAGTFQPFPCATGTGKIVQIQILS